MIEDSDIGGPDGRGPRETVPEPPAAAEDGAGADAGPGGRAAGVPITFKLYATLQDLLPKGAVRNAVAIEIAEDASLNDVIDRYQVPRELAHLVLVNGVFVGRAERDAPGLLSAGDVLAIWPPVAGG